MQAGGEQRYALALGQAVINVWGELPQDIQQRLFEDWEAPQAEELQATINQVRPIYQGLSAITALKAIVAHYHNDPEWARVRPPLVELDAAATQAVVDRFAKLPVAAEIAI